MKRRIISALFAAVITIIMAACLSACIEMEPPVIYTKSDGILQYSRGTIAGCVDENIAQIIIPESVTYYKTVGGTVEETTFKIDAIAHDAFKGHKKLERIVIPQTVLFIPNGAFAGCSNLKSIEISPENPVYKSAGNCVIEAESKTVIAGCNVSVIPADGTVTEIGDLAFSGCTLDNFKIGDTITKIGEQAFANCTLDDFKIADSVTEVGERAFANCKFDSLTLSNSLTTLGAECFANSNLKTIALPASVTEFEGPFDGCATLESIVADENSPRFSSEQGIVFNKEKTEIVYAPLGLNGEISVPSSVKMLTAKAFANRGKITKLIIPENTERIEEGAFAGCNSLESLTTPLVLYDTEYLSYETTFNRFFNGAVPEALEEVILTRGEVGDKAFENSGKIKTVILEEGVTRVGYFAFENCKSLENLEVKGAEYIDHLAFYGCTKLKTVVFYDGVQSISDSIFYECGGLNELTLSAKLAETLSGKSKDGITARKLTITSGEIGYYAFRFCNIDELYIGDGVTAIRAGAFNRCHNLKKVDLGHGVTVIESFAFPAVGKFALEYNLYDNAYYLGNADNPYYFLVEKTANNITSCQIHPQTRIIGESAFNYCEQLSGVTIPDNVVTVGYRAFYNCKSIEKIILPQSVRTIGEYAFGNCDKLKYFYIPSGVTRIEEYCPNPPYCQVFYEGTAEQLKSIYVGAPIEGNPPFWVNIYYYSPEKPTTEGKFWHYENGKITEWTE